jgi:hypothetical protein
LHDDFAYGMNVAPRVSKVPCRWISCVSADPQDEEEDKNMIERDSFEIWNLTEGRPARCGAVSIFNLVGRIRRPETVKGAAYSLNGAAPVPIYFNRRSKPAARLRSSGDFNIDTINSEQLKDDNELHVTVAREDGRVEEEHIAFRTARFDREDPSFRLDLSDIRAAGEVGQIVDGHWRVAEDAKGRRCLEVRPDETGYDRIILFGRREWSTNYELFARLSITRILAAHNLGFIFRWNPHEQGDGTRLPTKWGTGLAYYCSYGNKAGLRIRYGVEVHLDAEGRKQGDYLLGYASDGPYSKIVSALPFLSRFSALLTDLKVGPDYCMRMRVTPERYSLTVWLADKAEPAPQVVVDEPTEHLTHGSVGILALHTALRLYEFQVRPITTGSP